MWTVRGTPGWGAVWCESGEISTVRELIQGESTEWSSRTDDSNRLLTRRQGLRGINVDSDCLVQVVTVRQLLQGASTQISQNNENFNELCKY